MMYYPDDVVGSNGLEKVMQDHPRDVSMAAALSHIERWKLTQEELDYLRMLLKYKGPESTITKDAREHRCYNDCDTKEEEARARERERIVIEVVACLARPGVT